MIYKKVVFNRTHYDENGIEHLKWKHTLYCLTDRMVDFIIKIAEKVYANQEFADDINYSYGDTLTVKLETSEGFM